MVAVTKNAEPPIAPNWTSIIGCHGRSRSISGPGGPQLRHVTNLTNASCYQLLLVPETPRRFSSFGRGAPEPCYKKWGIHLSAVATRGSGLALTTESGTSTVLRDAAPTLSRTYAGVMTKYKVRLQAQVGEDANDVILDAASVKAALDWVIFYRGAQEQAHTVVAVFPKERVISVVTEEK